MNKNLLIGLVLVVIALVAYFGFIQKKEDLPVPIQETVTTTLPTQNTQPEKLEVAAATLKTSAASTTATTPGWKIFAGGGISLSAPSSFTMNSMPTENGTILMIGIGNGELGVMTIYKFSNKETYQREMVDNRPTDTPPATNYSVNGIPAKLYVDNDGESEFTISIIDIPSHNTIIMLTPSPKEWPGVPEADVNKIIQSIKL